MRCFLHFPHQFNGSAVERGSGPPLRASICYKVCVPVLENRLLDGTSDPSSNSGSGVYTCKSVRADPLRRVLLAKKWHRFCLVKAIRREKQVQRSSVVKPVSRTDQTKKKVHCKRNKDGEKVMSFASLLNEFSGRSRIIATPKIATNSAHGIMPLGRLNVTQKSTFELLKVKV